MQDQLQVVLKEQNIPKENAEQLLKAFGMPLEEVGEILVSYKDIVVTDEEQFDLMAEARSKRLKLKEIRVSVEKKRKELKEDSLRTGRAIDGVANLVKQEIEPAEKYLESQEKFAEIRQAERAAKLKAERIESLVKYTDDISLYDLDSITEEQFKNLLANLKAQHKAKIAEEKRIEEERVAKEKAEAEERERIRKENERLKAEAEAREAEQAKKDAAERAERERIQKEAEEKLAKERAERKKLEAENREREAIEAEKKRAAEEAERQALLAPDKEKLSQFANALGVIRTTKLPAVKSKQAQDVLNIVDKKLADLVQYIVESSKGL